MSHPSTYDAVVVGGGPAGSAVGRLLALWGHRTLILARPRPLERGLAESIPPSARKLLAAISVLDAVDRAAFQPNRGNVVWWGSTEGRLEEFGESESEAGIQVLRPDFDALLLHEAANAGAEVRRGAVARAVHVGDDALATVVYEAGGERHTVRARFAVDCSGLAGIIARRGYRVYAPNHRMQAFVGTWRHRNRFAVRDDRTIVETYEDGWAWSLSISPTVRQIAVMVNGATTRTTRGPTIAHAFAAELRKTKHLRALTDDATLEHVWACDSSMYTANTFAGTHFLLVGDAGTRLDPLSSFGVKKALASGWLAAVALHTSLVDPQRQAIAFDFFSQREREVYDADLVRTEQYAARAYEHHRHPFWRTRSAERPADPAETRSSASARAALEKLRAAASVDLRWNRRIQLVKRPLVRGREIVLDDAVPIGRVALRYVSGVDLVMLGHTAGRHRHVPALYDEYCRVHGQVPLPQFLAGLSLLIAEGVLE
jgi:halogenation protein CepH